MKILEISRGMPFVNKKGIGIFEFDQAKALKSIGNEVVFASLDMRSIRRRRKFGFSKHEEEGIPCFGYDIPVGRVPSWLMNRLLWHYFKKLYKKIVKEHGKPDIIHGHFAVFCGYVCSKAKKKFGVDYVITEHNSAITENKIKQGQKKYMINSYNHAKQVIAVSKQLKAKLKQDYQTNATYIPNIVETETFNLPANKVGENVACVAGLIERKGIFELINAIKVLAMSNFNKKVYIIGDGVCKKDLQKLIEKFALQNQVFLLGRKTREETNKIYEECAYFVLPSKAETFGVVYIEAMAAGLPVIATRCGGPESFVTEEVGILIDVDNDQQLVQAMQEISQKNWDRNKIRQYSIANFSPEVVARQIIEVVK